MTETDFYFYDVIALIFIAGGLYAYLCSLKKTNKELKDLLEVSFENEQHLADKLEIAHNALKEANNDIQFNNQSGVFNNRVRLINTALEESKPEYLEF